MAVGVGARYVCGDEERRAALERAIDDGVVINGIDFLEVLDRELIGILSESTRQRILLIQCFAEGIDSLSLANVRIDGGVRIAPIHIRWVQVLSQISAASPSEIPVEERTFLETYRENEIDRERILAVGTEERGDYSTYCLSLVEPGEIIPVSGFDPRLASVDFSFKVECPSDFDCKVQPICPPPELSEPVIDYLAKDYTSFRQLMLDRMSAIIPHWQERSPADAGVVLVEMLAYVGDQLSYYQDAAATEAYLGTARQRISVRRHTRLVDYFLGEGVNARVWIACEVESGSDADGATLNGPQPGVPGTRFVTLVPGQSPNMPVDDLSTALQLGSEFFESLWEVTLRHSLNRMDFYTWSNRSCCLPIGATKATLLGHHLDLAEGMFLLFEEILGSKTGNSADADPLHRQVIRLTRVEFGDDPVEGEVVTEIEWDHADALRFPLCLSAQTDDEHGSRYEPAVSVVRGNLLAADHGRFVFEDLDPVPKDPSTFRPHLDLGSLIHAAPVPPGNFPASWFGNYSATDAHPSVRLISPGGEPWLPQRDLLSSHAASQEFVAEIGNDGRARLRFGDDSTNGKRPTEDVVFRAEYRVGEALAGNIGVDGIAHVVDAPAGITRVRNPLPSFGAQSPELLEEARRYAPQAFRRQERAVTADDYARVAERHPEIQRAAARFRWTGSWYTVFISLDRRGGRLVDSEFVQEMRDYLNRFRMAGFDLEIRPPRFVSLEITLVVCVEPGYLRAKVKQVLAEVFSNRRLPIGSLGFFHPDNWTFGQPVYLSQIYKTASQVAGVHAVTVETFKRWGQVATTELDDGVLPIGEREIARLNNDPSLPEHGLLEFQLEGGL